MDCDNEASYVAYDNFFLQASNNCITSLPEDLAHCLKLIKLDVEVLAFFFKIFFKEYLMMVVWFVILPNGNCG